MIIRLFVSLVIAVAHYSESVAESDTPTVHPNGYDTFRRNFKHWVAIHGSKWVDGTYNPVPLNRNAIAFYGQYEPWYCWRRAAEHFGDPNGLLERYAAAAGDAWRDHYALATYSGKPLMGQVPGYSNYSDGLRLDFMLTGDERSRRAVVELSTNAAYAKENTPLSWTLSANDADGSGRSREVAYAVLSYINAEVFCGQAHRHRVEELVEQMVGNTGHINQWLGSYRTAADGKYMGGKTAFAATDYAPFFGAITALTLISYYENSSKIDDGIAPDGRVIPELTRLADATWNECWEVVPHSESFYLRPSQSQSAPDLNNVIFPYYAWLYLKTGETRFKTRCDLIFHGSRRANLAGAKQFNQYARWTFDGIEWYSEGAAKWR